jgi:hypothetical protein
MSRPDSSAQPAESAAHDVWTNFNWNAKGPIGGMGYRVVSPQRPSCSRSGTLARRDAVDALIESIAGTVLTPLGGMSARCSRDMQVRRGIDAVVDQIRREIAAACLAKAEEWNEPPLNEQ